MPIEQPWKEIVTTPPETKETQENKTEKNTNSIDAWKKILEDISKEEQKAILEENVTTAEGRDLIVEKIKSWDIMPDVFGLRYAGKTGAEKLSDQLQTNVNTMFEDIQSKNWPQKMLMSQRWMMVMLERVAWWK